MQQRQHHGVRRDSNILQGRRCHVPDVLDTMMLAFRLLKTRKKRETGFLLHVSLPKQKVKE
jgi:hypothetical protein